MNRTEAEIKLKKLFGFDKFYDSQWAIIEKILETQVSHSKIRTTGRQPSAFQNLVDFWS